MFSHMDAWISGLARAGMNMNIRHIYGYEYPDAPTRLRQLREGVQVILKMWSDEEAHFEGK